jgi:hypothetical protein
MVEPDAFEVGVDLAVTPGAVVLRTPVFELIQYRPATPAGRQVPLLMVPPVINKFYGMDLAPARTGNGPRSAGRWSGGCPSSASSARTSRGMGAPG